MIAAIFLGAFPHGSMASGSAESSEACFHNELGTAMDENHSLPCGAGDQSMGGACAIGCHGPAAFFVQSVGIAANEFGQVLLWRPTSLALSGRPIDPADRPPRTL
jgi:hypothetical protein